MLEASGSHVVRAVSILIAACLAAFPAYAKYSGGTGEPNDPYQIATAADLIALGETPEDYDKHFILTADIDLDPNLPGRKVFDKAVIGPDTDPPNKYLLNPYDGTAFTGVFDGDGHTISHLTINGESYLGLFGHFGEGYVQAEVRNLGIADVNIVGSGSYVGGLTGLNLGTVTQCYATGVVTGDEYVGGLTGFNWGTVTQCYGTGVVTGDEYVGELVGKNYGSIAASYSTGAVSGGSSVGGLVGSNGGTVTNCYNTGVVTGSGAYVGGLMGINEEYASVTHSYSTGAVRGTGNSVGGLVGENDESALISDCYSTGVVSASEAVGGLVGGNGGTVSRCYSTGAVTGSGQEYIGGLVGCPWVWGGVGAPGHEILGFVNNCFWDNQTSGQATSGGGTGKTTAQMQDPNTFVAVGWDFVNQPDDPHDIWSEPEGGGYPILYWQLPPEYGLPSFSGGTGEPNDPYTISTAEQLNHIGHNPRLMKCHFKLIAALDLTGSHFYPIGDQEFPYGGIFEGDGRTISNLTIMGDDCLGLFGRLEAGAVVKELGVVDVNVTGSWDVGGLVGANGGTVTQCYSTGAVSGAGGGLVGANGGTVTQCFSTAAVSGGDSVGGLVGSNHATVTDCYSTGAVSGTEQGVGGLVGWNNRGVTRCYSTGKVIGGGIAGGLLGGSGTPGCFNNSVWDMGTSGQVGSAGGVGLTTTEMMDPFMLGLNGFADDPNWVLDAGHDYPRLAWEGTPGQMIPQPRIDWLQGHGTAEDSYRIDTADQLILLGKASILWDKHFLLGSDIDLDRKQPGRQVFGQAVIQIFAGVFDGNGHTLSHLTIMGDDYLGVFGQLASRAQVRNLGVVDVNIVSSGNRVGGLVGYNSYGLVTDCYSTGSVSGDTGVGGLVGGLVGSNSDGFVTDCYCTAAVSGTGDYVGGLVGFNSDGFVTDCYSTGSVSGTWYVGGLVGSNRAPWSARGVVSGCYSTGTVSGTSAVGGLVGTSDGRIAASYSTGSVSGTDYWVGGLLGSGSPTRVTACFWDIQTSGLTESAGGTGKTTAEMQTAATFLEAGWDFVGEAANGTNDIWKIAEGLDYPRLWWEPYDGRVTVVLGQVFTVTLESNPSTGYRWEWVDHQDSIVEQMGQAQFKPRETGDPPLVGAGGWESFDFKAVHPGQMTLKLVYRRPWEEGVEPLKTFSLQVTVP